MTSPLRDIHEGMKVADASGKDIGTVEWVHMSDEDPETAKAETITPGEVDQGRDSLLEKFFETFRADDLPEVLRNRLLREGFIRMDADGLFAADRYVLPQQIRSVADGRVTLDVNKDELISR